MVDVLCVQITEIVKEQDATDETIRHIIHRTKRHITFHLTNSLNKKLIYDTKSKSSMTYDEFISHPSYQINLSFSFTSQVREIELVNPACSRSSWITASS